MQRIFYCSEKSVIALVCLLLSCRFLCCKSATVVPRASSLTSTAPDNDYRDDNNDDVNDDDWPTQLWLDDFDTELRQEDKEDLMQSDSPPMLRDGSEDADREADEDDDEPICPPPPRHLPPFSCSVAECDSDKACQTGTICCYNGCRYTCMTPVETPPYVDWKRQPRRRLASGSSWLVPGPEEKEAEWCSTSSVFGADEDPLLCPHGYICHIEDAGQPEKGIPNSGICVNALRSNHQNAKRQENDLNGDCQIGKAKHPDGSTFKYTRKTCTCKAGVVLCKVGKSTQRKKQI